jgi:oxepin-CoA hydrolase/3-oxo-5,6-dehydrosuberyl-CoA semialdehyde dehydrogenase
MQRTAIQGSPNSLTQVTHHGLQAKVNEDRVHPFKKDFDELVIGERLLTARRTVTEADIVNFACLSGDYFYAHTDKIAAPSLSLVNVWHMAISLCLPQQVYL